MIVMSEPTVPNSRGALKGNPKKMQNSKVEKALRFIRMGNYVKPSVIAAGINYNTHLEWMKKGKKGISPYKEYFESVLEARNIAETSHVENVHESAMAGNVGASQWWLSRMHPDRWGKKEKIEAKVDNSQRIEFVLPKDKESKSKEEE